jgi:putative transposase
MKDSYPKASLVRFCRLFGITPQAYYQHFWRVEATSLEDEFIIKEVSRIRENHRRMGTRKLYELLEPFMLTHRIKMGRDALFTLLSAHNLLVRRKRRRKISTTDSYHQWHTYPNLILGFAPDAPNKLWVSDITYFEGRFDTLYISLITDAYSHKVVGYQIAESLKAIESIQALKMALKDMQHPVEQLIHHSDRGSQYCCKDYVRILKKKAISISMTQTGDPRENAIAERINGIIKQEYMDFYSIENLNQAKQCLAQAIYLYNTERPHLSLGMLTPDNVHKNNLQVEKLWKNKSYFHPPGRQPIIEEGAAGGQNNFYHDAKATNKNANIVNSFQD